MRIPSALFANSQFRMTKNMFRLTAVLFFVVPATALAQAPVTLTFADSDTSSTTQQLLIQSNALLNVYEATLLFDPTITTVTDFTISSDLCDEQFVIEKRIDNISGELYVACGTLTPFSSETAYQPLLAFDFISQATTSPFLIGDRTTFHQHDGLGTVSAWEEG